MNNYSPTGWPTMDNFLGGGLKRGQVSFWTALTHNFRTGTLLNMALGMALAKPSAGGERQAIIFASVDGSEGVTMRYLYRGIMEIEGQPIDDDGQRPATYYINYVQQYLAERGWHLEYLDLSHLMSEVDPHADITAAATALIRSNIERLRTRGVHTRHLLMDNLDMLKGRQPMEPAMDYLLSRLISDQYHLALSSPLCVDAKRMLRDVDSGIAFLRVASRTGYVPRMISRRVDQCIVHHVIRPGPEGGTPKVGYHYANERFDDGEVYMDLTYEGFFSEPRK